MAAVALRSPPVGLPPGRLAAAPPRSRATRLAAWTAGASWAAIRVASSTAASTTSGPGTTRLTSRSSSARCASTGSPSSSSSIAIGHGRRWGRRTAPPEAAISPTVTSGRPNLACSAATTRSQARTISKPPPMAAPLTAATIGLGKSRRTSPAKPPETPLIASAWPASTALRSMPAEKTRSPAPVRTTARVASSRSSSSKVAASASPVSRSIALARSGRSIVTTLTPSCCLSETGIAACLPGRSRFGKDRDRMLV